ncbi:MAG: hypothetical protein LBU20_02275 [Candidatus Nomurabacteria bacterium]|jgi:membrane protein implicated in regulation of membrane protease activity|nr:hypothetical protein [Candidatus Nomurabacteria bacterium]
MKKDIKLPHKKPKKTFKSLKKSFSKSRRAAVKRAIDYFRVEKSRGSKSLQSMIFFGLVVAALALMLGLIPNLNSFGAWLAVMALAIGLLGFLNKAGGRTKQLLLLATVALVVSVISVSVQNGLRQSYINNIIDRKDGRATIELLKKDVDIEIGELSAEGLTISLHNKNSATKAYSIVVLAKTAAGENIIEQTVSFGVLDPDESKEYKIFSTASEILKEKLKTASFEIVTVSQY